MNCTCHKEQLKRLQVYNIIQFLNNPNQNWHRKMVVRKFWAQDKVSVANDWIAIYYCV
jgi:hypothetical protein